MTQRLSGSAKTGDSGALVLADLSSRTDLPQRARALLGGALELCRKYFTDSLNTALDEFQKHLFKLSEVSRNNEQQQNYFLSARELSNVRSQIVPRFLDVLEDFFAGFDQRARAGVADSATTESGRESLSLVETGELEESLALQEFVARAEVRHSQALYALGHRFAVLAALPALDAQALPIGPAQLGKALRHAGAVLNISPEHRVLLYRTFDQLATKDIVAVYDAVNAYFVQQHILMNLRAQAKRGKKTSAGAGTSAEETAQNDAADAAQAEQSARHDSPSAAAAGAAARRGGESARSGTPPSTHSDIWNAAQSLADDRDTELFSTLRELLAGSRKQTGSSMAAAQAGASGGYVPSFEDVQAVLGALQSKPVLPSTSGGKAQLRSVADLKQDLLQELAELSPNRQAPQLNSEDSDTIDLVGMLFEHMSGGLPSESSTRSLLPRLQVPLLRVALRDKSFFTRKTHPARQLLNSIADTGERWMDGTDPRADSDLLNRLQVLLDRLSTEFDGDLSVIDDLLGDLSEHVQTLTRKAEVAERRQVDAAVGREKLALAREAAATAVADRISANPPGPFVRTLLEQAWADVLALTLLRQGESSDAYKKRIDVADRLIESSAAAQKGDASAQPPSEELREEIETGLSQVGYHEDDIQAVVKRLFVPEGAANEAELISETELANKLASKARLGDDAHAGEKPIQAAAKRKEALQLNEAEKNTLEQLKQLPFGTWFDFVTNQQGDRIRKKMAWYSKLTGRCMFVNQRGARTDDTTLEELARDMARGQVFITQVDQDTFVDRAWGTIVSSLKRLGSLAGAFAPPPPEPIA